MSKSKGFFSLAIVFLAITSNFCFSQVIVDDLGFSYNTVLSDYGIVSSIKKENKSQLVLLGGNDGIVKIDSLGKKITSFAQGTFLYETNNSVIGFLETSDSKILAYGFFPGYQGYASQSLVRIHPDGIVDQSFTFPAPNNTIYVKAIAELPNGKYLCSMGSQTTNIGIVQLNNDGSFDPNFVSPFPSGASQNIAEFVVLADSSVLIVLGNFIQKMNPDGTLDNSFNSPVVGPQGPNNYSDCEVLSDGRLLFLSNNTVYRLLANGSVDNSFTPLTIPTSQFYAKKIVETHNNKFYVYGKRSSTTAAPFVKRYHLNGTIDNTFNIGQGFSHEYFVAEANSIVPFDDGTLSVAGVFDNLNNVAAASMAVLNNSGSPVWMHKTGTGLSNYRAYTMHVDVSNHIYVGGDFDTYNGLSRNKITKLDRSGHTDYSFKPGTGFNGDVKDIITQTDGKVVVCGGFTSYNGTSVQNIVRLNQNGTIDNSFSAGTGFSGYTPYALGIQSDGKIIVAGDFSSYNNSSVARIIRLLPNGSLDVTFTPSSGPDDTVLDLIVKPNDQLLICGEFGTYAGVLRAKIALLSSNGVLDNSFVPSAAYAHYDTRAMAIQSDGKIVVGGQLNSFTDNLDRRVGRLNPDGSTDPTFVPDIAIYDFPESIGLLPNGRIIVGAGSITIYENDGSLVANEVINTVSGPSVKDLYVNPSGNPILTGYFTLNPEKFGIARLKLAPAIQHTQQVSSCGPFTWINGVTYTTSTNTPDYTFTNQDGVDSIITLDLTIIPSLPLTIENSFSIPSNANTCTGEAAIDLSGNAPFELDFDNGSQVITSNGYSLVANLCPGVHDLQVTDNCGDTLSTTIVIPVDSDYVFNNPFIDSLAQDSLGVTLTNCDIYYAGIDTAYIDSIWATGNTVNVIWNIVDSNGSNFDTTTYVLNNGNGVYWLQLSVFCPSKSVGEYFTVTEAIYLNNGHVSTAGLTNLENKLFEIYPNPTNDRVHINFSGSDAELTVYDVQGKVVLKDQIQNQEIISLQNFERGVYLFDFKNSQGHSVQRVIKQ